LVTCFHGGEKGEEPEGVKAMKTGGTEVELPKSVSYDILRDNGTDYKPSFAILKFVGT